MKEELHLTNELSQLNRLNDFIVSVADELGLDASGCMRLNLALEEAVTNVILYAYPGEKGKDICLKVEQIGEKLIIIIIDEGIPFDPTQKETPDLSLSIADRPIGGLGIHLIREIMNEVGYERKGDKNILTMTKDLR